LARNRKLRRDVGVEHLLAGLIELVHRPGFTEARGKLRSRLRGRLGLHQERDEFLRADRAVKGPPGLDRDAQRLKGSAQLRLMEARRGNVRARRQRRKRNDIGNDLSLDLEDLGCLDRPDRDRRIRRETCSHSFCIGFGQLVVGGLQAAIVEERDLDRGVGGQSASKEAPNHDPHRLCLVGCTDRGHILAELPIRDICDDPHAGVRRKPGAPGDQGDQQESPARAGCHTWCKRQAFAPKAANRGDVPTGKHWALLLARLRRRGHALVLLAPRRRIGGPLALVGPHGGAIADGRRAGCRVCGIRPRHGQPWRVAAPGEQQGERRHGCDRA
jgi:hypothetical protein